ncbi:MAG: hypothetical protein B7Y80_01345 [Hyphomicrobium sp. 32-62-53]|nr:MAG: hypothetical protein B7Z29_01690 [Hyphomicrobium sp. 12-62-95]OYY01401.1 MAG: hypothetical protein B7Y80_01345 [Hyphomicrobium sp. 32-62-53]
MIRRGFFAAVLVWPLAAVTGPAHAAEQIVLPFECNVVGGRVQVRPSGDQAYRIYGARRQDQYRACSEQNPDRCRTFLLQSFTMACGRGRADWSDVYAAISKVTDGRAFYNNDGRLYYRMGPREPQDSYPFPAPRHAMGVVELPDGFAPMAGVDAIFTPLDPRVAELEDIPPPDARAARGAQPQFAPALTPKPAEKPTAVVTPKVAEEPKLVTPPKPAEPPKSEVVLEPKPLETASTNSAPAAAPPPETITLDAAAPVMPTILNNPAAKEVETASKTETVVAAAEIAPPPQPQAATDAGPRVEGWSATGGSGLSVPPIAFAILIAAATLAILLVILKKQAASPVAVGPMRGPIEPTLPGFDRAPADQPGQALTVRDDPGPPALSAIAASTGMPVTRDDALAFLGLNTGASEAVIRKVVEGLRQSWHPDLACDETDRAAREERIKAINAAAAILQRKTAA